MLITLIPALILIIVFFTFLKDFALVLSGIGGFIYFLIDYRKQGLLSLTLMEKPYLTLKDDKNFYNIMATKCSRSMLYEYMRRLPLKQERVALLTRMRATGFRWFHLFPMTNQSLTQRILLPRSRKIKQDVGLYSLMQAFLFSDISLFAYNTYI